MNSLVAIVTPFLPVLVTLALVVAGLALINWVLRRRWQDDPDAQFRFQLIMLALTFAGLLSVILALPVDETTRGQLLSLIGILLSAAIALSSTTFIGNIMAGIMLKVVRSARPGDFVTVADLTGRVTEMGLLHTKVQTEFRDLVTVPNLYMVTQPLQVVRSSGTIISAEVSLGYETPHGEVATILSRAVTDAGLKDGFVHIRQLGDFSVTYRVAGLLEDVKSLLSARSALREHMLDALHAAGIEIVSPNFMNTRAVPEERVFIPEVSRKVRKGPKAQAEDLAFDIAEKAAVVENLRKAIATIDAELEQLEDAGEAVDAASRDRLKDEQQRLRAELDAAEEKQKAAELTD